MSKSEDLRFLFCRLSWRMKYFCAWLATCECVLEGTKCVEMPFQSPCRAKPILLLIYFHRLLAFACGSLAVHW